MKFLKLKSVIVLVCSISLCAAQKSGLSHADSVFLKKLSRARVIEVQSITKSGPANSARLGDEIAVKVLNLDSIISDSAKISLVLNGNILGITPERIDRGNSSVIFVFDSILLKKYFNSKSNILSSCVSPEVSIRIKETTLASDVKKFKFYLTIPRLFLKGTGLILIIFLILFILGKYTDVLRSGDKDSAFSLAQTQLAFWTVVISVSVVYIWIVTEILPDLTSQALTLLGISGATTVSSKMISTHRYEEGKIKAPKPKRSFLKDILSDSNGSNAQRFQAFVWTIIMGCIFLFHVLIDRVLYTFHENYLLLTGISSGIYVALKFSENGKNK